MARLASTAANRVRKLLAENNALSAQVAELALEAGVRNEPPVTDAQLLARNVAAELAERTAGVTYPAFFIYCDKLTNALREKFRVFSGTARIVVEARASQDRLEGLEDRLRVYVDAVTNVLDANRGDWSNGWLYTGGYEVTFAAAKHGGKNFLQIAKVVFEIEISTD